MAEPAGTDNAAPTAPAASAPASTSTPAPSPVSTAPASALASLEKVAAAASSADKPTTLLTDPNASVGTTVQPGQPGANVGAQGEGVNPGEDAAWLGIPETRRNTILENARTKEREKVLATVDARLGWAKGIDPEQVQASFGVTQRLAANPVNFAVQLISEIRSNPQMAAAFEAAMGGQGITPLPTSRGAFKLPVAHLKSEDGKGAYTETQIGEILESFRADLMSQFGEQIRPLEEMRGSLEEREAVMEVIQTSRQETNTLLGEMRALAHWPQKDATGKNPGEAKIGEYLNAIPPKVKKQIGAVASMYRAFNAYLEKDVFPTLSARTEQTVRDDLKRKAAAATGAVAPTTGATVPPPQKPRNVQELARHMERLAAAQV